MNGSSGRPHDQETIGIFSGPWDTGHSAKDGAVLGFEDVYRAFSEAALTGDFTLLSADIEIFRDYRQIRTFLEACDVVYANCGPWAALLHVVRSREQLDVRIIREVRTVGWIGYIWQEDVAGRLERPGDGRVFPARYPRDIWVDVLPGVSHSHVFYPMIRNGAAPTATKKLSGTVGFFSRLSSDKGFGALPGAIARLLTVGHQIDRVILAGNQEDVDLYTRVVKELADLGVQVAFRGGLPNSEVRALMAECDCVFFLSTSSIEAGGRVLVEAYERGVPVVAADFGSARDLVSTDYRIPARYGLVAAERCDSAVSLAELDVEAWQPPSKLSVEACFLESIDDYRVGAQKAVDVLAQSPSERPADPSRRLAFSFTSKVDALLLANQLLDEPSTAVSAPVQELMDLGGALKRYLLANGYNPSISFEPRAI